MVVSKGRQPGGVQLMGILVGGWVGGEERKYVREGGLHPKSFLDSAGGKP